MWPDATLALSGARLAAPGERGSTTPGAQGRHPALQAALPARPGVSSREARPLYRALVGLCNLPGTGHDRFKHTIMFSASQVVFNCKLHSIPLHKGQLKQMSLIVFSRPGSQSLQLPLILVKERDGHSNGAISVHYTISKVIQQVYNWGGGEYKGVQQYNVNQIVVMASC